MTAAALLTPAQVAEQLQVSEWLVKQELGRKNLRGIKTKAGWRVDQADLDTYIDAQANVARVKRPATSTT